jgi:hypothetical protein
MQSFLRCCARTNDLVVGERAHCDRVKVPAPFSPVSRFVVVPLSTRATKAPYNIAFAIGDTLAVSFDHLVGARQQDP